MKRTMWLLGAALLLGVSPVVSADTVAGLPLHVERLNPKAVRVWVGDIISSTATVAIATEKGIVVVDTLGVPKVDAELRRVIARELGRDDFKLLINTHEHSDHTDGNSVYADCAIAAHELCAAGIERNAEFRPRAIEFGRRRIGELQGEIEKLAKGAAEAKKLNEQLVLARLNLEAREANVAPALPTVTFSDRMQLDMGDTTFELYFVGGMHSASDIDIFVPEHGLLMTGDTMADVWLIETPGCLASFGAREGVRHDFPLMLKNWEILRAKKDLIKDFIPGHWNANLTLKGFEDRIDYIAALWEGVQRAAAAGKGLADVTAEFSLATRFPTLVESPGCSARANTSTLSEMWRQVTNQESAARTLYALIGEGAGEAAVREVLAENGKATARYYFDEAQFIGFGYQFMREDKVAQAIAMFRASVAAFPDAWNTYDSLGEALLKHGEKAEAIAMYEKSLVLNPENTNGKDVLARIRSAVPAT